MTANAASSPDAVGKRTSAARAEDIVKKFTLGSLAVGVIPLPLIDMAALAAVQLQLLARLAALYDLDFSGQRGQTLIASLVGGSTPILAAGASCRLITKFIPIQGWAVSAVSTSLFGAASTYAVGRVFVQHFESGGTFLTFDPDKVRQHYAEEFERARKGLQTSFAGIKP